MNLCGCAATTTLEGGIVMSQTRYRTKEEFIASNGPWRRMIYKTWQPDNVTEFRALDEIDNVSNNHILYQTESMFDDPSSSRGIKRLSHTKGTRVFAGTSKKFSYWNEYQEGPPWYLFTPTTIGGASVGEISPSFGSELTEQCLQKVANSSPERTVEESMMFIKDLRSTIKMIRNPFGILSDLASKARNVGKKATLRQVFERNPSVANGWLEYQFGWKPLINDVKNTVDALAGLRDSYNQYVNGNMSPTKGFTVKQVSTSAKYNSPIPEGPGFIVKSRSTHRARCLMWTMMQPSPQTMSYGAFVAKRFGLSSSNIIPTVWDAVPWSFVVDWFIPVGDYLTRITETPVKFDVYKTMYDYTVSSDSSTSSYCSYPLRDGGLIHSLLWSDHLETYTRGGDPFVASEDKTWFTNTRALDVLALIRQRLRMPISRK